MALAEFPQSAARPRRRLPRRGTLHVVYPCPERHGNHLALLKRWLVAACTGTPLEIACRPWRFPLSSPTSITHAIVEALHTTHRIQLYDHTSTGAISLGPRDLFLGHPMPDDATKDPARYHWRQASVTQTTNMTLRKYPNDPRIVMVSPFVGATETHGRHWINSLADICRNWIVICGDVWRDTIAATRARHPNCTLHPVNMFVYPDHYPFVKTDFAPPGRRRFLYIGRVSGEKNTNLISALAARIPGFSCGVITNEGDIEGCHRVSAERHLTPEYARASLAEYDFFISPSEEDAQATTVLEAMAWGLGIAATRESGYDHPSIFALRPHDLSFNLQVYEQLQQVPSWQLAEFQQANRALVETKYSVTTFRERVTDIMTRIMQAV